MRTKRVVVGLAGLAGILLMAGCHRHEVVVAGPPQPVYQPVYVQELPPPPPPEVVVVAPGPDYYVVPGYYRYDNRRYVWVARHAERRQGPNHVWVEPHWEHERTEHGYRHVPGHWEEHH